LPRSLLVAAVAAAAALAAAGPAAAAHGPAHHGHHASQHHHHHPPAPPHHHPAPPPPPPAGASTLLGRAVLPASTYAPGPVSGTLLGTAPVNGITPPFPGQPVQGISAALPAGHGTYWVMPDNGYGSIENSADFNLRVYQVEPHYKTSARTGAGTVSVKRFIQLHDPDHRIPFAIVNQWTPDRVLTGADFDPESLQRAPDGTLWLGEEFGPFLIHTDADGKVLHAPYPLPDPDNPGHELRSAQNPFSEESATLRVMNALRADAQHHGDQHTPVVSPDANLIDDGDPATAEPTRVTPPAGSGVRTASSELFDIASLHTAGFKVVPYTVDDADRMRALIKLGVDGIITDRPDLLHGVLAEQGLLNADGTVKASFDAEAHRGGRDLRPENSLPSMEVGLDELATTLETDQHLTKDGVPVLSHDPYVDTGKCRRTDGRPYGTADQVLIKDLTLAQLQSEFVCDGVIRTGTPQSNDRALSPAAVAFAQHEGLSDPYVIPSTQQLFDFVTFYADYYQGKDDTKAANAARVRFNIETKLNPRTDRDALGNVYADRTPGPERITRAVAGVIEANDMVDRSDIQSFDFRTLRITHREFPELATVALWGDTPALGDAVDDDGTNLQPQGDEPFTRWLAGAPWPYRETEQDTPFTVQTSGGFESMALTTDGRTLLPMLEKPLAGAAPTSTAAYAFDLRTQRYTGRRITYNYDPKGVSVADFQMVDRTHGLTLERDNTQGDLGGFKALEQVTLDPSSNGTTMTKRLAADLMHISDPAGITRPIAGDVGFGDPFAFPFQTIETIVLLDPGHVLIANDNNYPFSLGRHTGTGAADDDELIVLKLARPADR
jgi:glycerophosphoryl diester phosphodiesterase